MTFKKIVFVSFGLFFLVACGNNEFETIEVKNDEGILIEEFTQRKADKVKHGIAKLYGSKGELLEEINYQEGLMDGERKLFYPDGSVMIKETYDKGYLSGDYTKYHENGTVQYVANYVLKGVVSERIGKEKHYYDDGTLKAMLNFKENVENGPFTEYHPNGKIAFKGTAKDGLDFGILEKYDENGVLIKKLDCENERCVTVWEKE